MRLLSLEVQNYRNIASASLTPGRELTVICGNNGQGKTNLLEAIWLLTGGKSFRGGKDAELVRRGEPFAVLEASTQRAQKDEQEPDDPTRVRLTIGTPDSPRPGRTASVNGAPPKRAASLAGSFPAVVFDPGHLSLVKGAPEGRRKFLDAALCQLYPGYLTIYRRYVRALQQKNALLRRSSTAPERPYAEKAALLEVLNNELALQRPSSSGGGRTLQSWLRWPAPIMRSFPGEPNGSPCGMRPSLSRAAWRPCSKPARPKSSGPGRAFAAPTGKIWSCCWMASPPECLPARDSSGASS